MAIGFQWLFINFVRSFVFMALEIKQGEINGKALLNNISEYIKCCSITEISDIELIFREMVQLRLIED